MECQEPGSWAPALNIPVDQAEAQRGESQRQPGKRWRKKNPFREMQI